MSENPLQERAKAAVERWQNTHGSAHSVHRSIHQFIADAIEEAVAAERRGDNALGLPQQTHRELGKTGDYPRGQLSDDDEGGLRLAVGHTASEVIVDFGTPVVWFGLSPDDAVGFARLLIEHAEDVKRSTPKEY